MTTVAFSVQVS